MADSCTTDYRKAFYHLSFMSLPILHVCLHNVSCYSMTTSTDPLTNLDCSVFMACMLLDMIILPAFCSSIKIQELMYCKHTLHFTLVCLCVTVHIFQDSDQE